MDTFSLDLRIIRFFRKVAVPVARIGLFIVFFWFGALKLLGVSPAGDLVRALYEQTVPILSFDAFFFCFALLECIIGFLFLIPGAERVVIPLLFAHMVTTFLPLFMLSESTWQSAFVPTLEGQYIIKNLVIIAAALGIAAHVRPLRT